MRCFLALLLTAEAFIPPKTQLRARNSEVESEPELSRWSLGASRF